MFSSLESIGHTVTASKRSTSLRKCTSQNDQIGPDEQSDIKGAAELRAHDLFLSVSLVEPLVPREYIDENQVYVSVKKFTSTYQTTNRRPQTSAKTYPFTTPKMATAPYKIRTYTLSSPSATQSYAKHWQAHISSLETLHIRTIGVWTAWENQVIALVKYKDGDDPREMTGRYMQSQCFKK
jgi:hypothetical protein